ncbi:MAG: hypothetical protein L0Z53_12885, partial [Acidobacteriales bacterium]|nr:hypothetical protein [Terriglobales bacterium]
MPKITSSFSWYSFRVLGHPEAETDFAEYFRHGKLIITVAAQWDEGKGGATVTQHGQRFAMKAFGPFFEALGDGALVPAL